MPEPGRIDIHCHLLPAIDDGCVTADDAALTIERLIERGYSTSICTPHIWPDMYPAITPARVDEWTRALGAFLRERGIEYELLSGAEVRLFKGAVKWFQTHGVPTLGPSNLVLLDSWDAKFPRHAFKTIDWLLDEGYRPVLAHPERAQIGDKIDDVMARLSARGVLFQGNLMPFAGLDVPCSDTLAWRFLDEGRYAMLALDLHRPDTLDDRLLGLDLVAQHIGDEALERLTSHAPRRLLFGSPGAAGPASVSHPA